MSELGSARADRDAALADVVAADAAPHRGHYDLVQRTLAEFIRSGRIFTIDDVARKVETAAGGPINRLLYGAAIQHAARTGSIEQIWQVRPSPSMRRCRHGSRNPWWRGVTVAEEDAA